MKYTVNKIFIKLVKYMPVVQITGILLNNTFYLNDNMFACIIAKYIFGGSIALAIFLLITSYLFDFCIWHRLLILVNFINNSVATYNKLNPISDNHMFVIHYLILSYSFLITIFTFSHIIKKQRQHEQKVTNDKKSIGESNRTNR